MGVAEDDQRPRREGAVAVCLHQCPELVAVTVVGEPVRGVVDVEPGDLVDLVDQCPGPTHDLSRPIAHLFGRGLAADVLAAALHDVVARCGKGTAQASVEPGLLEDLARRGDGPLLARIELALGPGPVVITGSVDHDDLEPAATVTPWQRPSGFGHRPAVHRPADQRRRALRRRRALVSIRELCRSISSLPWASRQCRVHRPSLLRCQLATSSLIPMAIRDYMLSMCTGAESWSKASTRRSRLRCIRSALPM